MPSNKNLFILVDIYMAELKKLYGDKYLFALSFDSDVSNITKHNNLIQISFIER